MSIEDHETHCKLEQSIAKNVNSKTQRAASRMKVGSQTMRNPHTDYRNWELDHETENNYKRRPDFKQSQVDRGSAAT